MTSRGVNFRAEEDILLCSVYLEYVQDPIIGKNQSKETLWKKISEIYNSRKATSWEDRNARSCVSRIKKIEKHVKKLMACIRQVKNTNPNGASEADIIVRAKMLMQTEKEYKFGFKFDHVFGVMKDFVKFEGNIQSLRRKAMDHMDSQLSHSSVNKDIDEPQHDSPTQNSTGLSRFLIDLNDGCSNENSLESTIGIKKAKKKKANEAETLRAIRKKEEQNERMMALIEKTNEIRSRNLDLKEDSILLTDVSKIADPFVRSCMVQRQTEIAQKRMRRTTPGETSSPDPQCNPNNYGYLTMLQSPDNSDLPPY